MAVTAKKKADTPAVQDPAVVEEQIQQEILTGIIDPDTRTYTMQKKITIGGEKRDGTFRFRYPTLGDMLRRGTLQARYLDGVSLESVDMATYNIAFCMSFLASVSVQLPPWFRYEAMESTDELRDMFEEVNAFVNSFRGNDAAASDVADREKSAR